MKKILLALTTVISLTAFAQAESGSVSLQSYGDQRFEKFDLRDYPPTNVDSEDENEVYGPLDEMPVVKIKEECIQSESYRLCPLRFIGSDKENGCTKGEKLIDLPSWLGDGTVSADVLKERRSMLEQLIEHKGKNRKYLGGRVCWRFR